MCIDIFRLNWILIDIIIIFLLIFFLIFVKIFKETNRWRLNFSNSNIQVLDLRSKINDLESNEMIKTAKYYHNDANSKEEDIYLCYYLSTSRKNKRIKFILTEGLASRGYEIIDLRYNIHNIIQERSLDLEKIYNKEIIPHISQENNIKFGKKICIFYDHKMLECLSQLLPVVIRSDLLIFINLRYEKLTRLKEFIDDLKKNECLDKSFFIFNNVNKTKETANYLLDLLKSINISLSKNIIKIESYKREFKYYETILLGILIGLIEN